MIALVQTAQGPINCNEGRHKTPLVYNVGSSSSSITTSGPLCLWPEYNVHGAFTLDVKSVLNENLGGIQGGTQC